MTGGEACIPSTIRVDPIGLELQPDPGQSLMAAAQAMGTRWPNVCGGQAQCGVCAVEVLSGEVSPPHASEAQMLARIPARPRHGGVMRLACQLTGCGGAVTVHKIGVRPPRQRES